MFKRLAVVVIIVALLIAGIPQVRAPVEHRITISFQQTKAHAQEEVGLLAQWLNEFFPGWIPTFVELGFDIAAEKIWQTISSLWSGRPDIGPQSATGCDATFFGYSQNGLVKDLGISFIALQSGGGSLSNWASPLFADKANKMCLDMEAKCGFQTGQYVCQAYCAIAFNYKNACSNFFAISRLQYYDMQFKICY